MACGLNNYGQLGLGEGDFKSRDRLCEVPCAALRQRCVQQVDGGSFHTGVLCTDGAVFVFGRADSGQLGIGADITKKAGACVARVSDIPIYIYTILA